MKQEGRRIYSFFLTIFFLLAIVMIYNALNQKSQENYTKAAFIADMEAGNVSKVNIQLNSETPTGRLSIELKNGETKTLYVSDVIETEEMVRSYGFDPMVHDVVRESWFLTTLVPMVIVIVVGIFLFTMISAQNAGAGAGNAKLMNFGKSRARMFTGDKRITFDQVAGLREEKEDLGEIVDFLKEPGKYNKVGARIPKGVLLEGPPGTGKTLLAKAVAGEANVAFFSISGSDFVEMYVGVGASRVRDMFEEAKKNAPCIVFIDEIDAVARRLGYRYGRRPRREGADLEPTVSGDGRIRSQRRNHCHGCYQQGRYSGSRDPEAGPL